MFLNLILSQLFDIRSQVNKYIMVDTFSRPSVDFSASLIDRVLNKGSQVLYDHYLVERLPEHSTLQNVLVIKSIMEPGLYTVQKSKRIANDYQPHRIHKDNIAAKSLQIKRIPISAPKLQLKPPTNEKISIKNRFSTGLRSQANAENKPILTKHGSSTLTPSPLIKLNDGDLPAEEVQRLSVEEKLRTKKHEQWIRKVGEKERSKQKAKDFKYRNDKLVKEFEDLQNRNLKYTYDFDGKIINCGPVNSHIPVFSKTLYPEMRVKLQVQNPHLQTVTTKHRSRQLSNQRSNTSKSQMFNSVAFSSVHASKLVRALRGNSLGTDFIRNDTFNNNNKRQLSNVNIIEISDGAKLMELDNQVVVASGRNEPVTLKDFTEMSAKKKFKSFLDLKAQVEVVQDEFDLLNYPEDHKDSRAATTKLPSSMSGRTKKYTFRDTINHDSGRKPMTATESIRKKSEAARPKTTSNFGRVIANYNMMELLFQ